MLILSTAEENKVTLKVGGSISLDGISAAIDFKNFTKEVELVDGKGAFTVTAEEAASLETPRVFARLEYSKDGKTIRTEFVDTIRVPRPVPPRDREIYSTIVIINAPLDDDDASALNAADGEADGGEGQNGASDAGQQSNLDNGAGGMTDADAGQGEADNADSDGGEPGQGEGEGQNGGDAANG